MIMRLILNLIWLILCGWWMAILYVIAGVICAILIITIPFAIASFRIASYVIWPFGRSITVRRDAGIGELAAVGIRNAVSTEQEGWRGRVTDLTGGEPEQEEYRRPAEARRVEHWPGSRRRHSKRVNGTIMAIPDRG